MSSECVFNLDQHTGSVHCVRYTIDGSYCMTASDDRTVRLWNPAKADPRGGEPGANRALCVQTYSGVHSQKVLDVAIAKDKTRFCSAGDDKSCYLWDVSSNRVIRRIQAHSQRTNAVHFNQVDDSVLFTASNDQTIKCWDLRSQSRDPIQVLSDFRDSVTSISCTDTSILGSSVDGHINIYDMRVGCLHRDQLGDAITSIQVSADQRTCIASCLHSRVSLVDIASGQILKEYTGHVHENLKTEATFCSDGIHVLSGSEDGRVVLWNLLQATIVHEVPSAHHNFKTHQRTGGVSSIAAHPTDASLFISAGYDGLVKVWRTQLAL